MPAPRASRNVVTPHQQAALDAIAEAAMHKRKSIEALARRDLHLAGMYRDGMIPTDIARVAKVSLGVVWAAINKHNVPRHSTGAPAGTSDPDRATERTAAP